MIDSQKVISRADEIYSEINGSGIITRQGFAVIKAVVEAMNEALIPDEKIYVTAEHHCGNCQHCLNMTFCLKDPRPIYHSNGFREVKYMRISVNDYCDDWKQK